MDAEPINLTEYPEPSIWPFLCAVVASAFFIGSIFTPWALPVAILPLAVTLIGWVWPKKRDRAREAEEHATGESRPAQPRPVQRMGEAPA